MKFNSFFNELKRRNVIKGALSYLVVSWVLLQVISLVGDILDAPSWIGKAVLVILLILFPAWVIFCWFFDITSEGIERTPKRENQPVSIHSKKVGKRLNIIIIGFLSVAVLLLFLDRFRLNAAFEQSKISAEITLKNTIAVLPFNDISIGQNQAYFADGLAEELIQNLSKITGMQVTSRTSSFSFKGKPVDIPTIAKLLNVNYVLEGSVRTQDSVLRISVQLIDTSKDLMTWSETWDRPLRNIFQIQNEISSQVADRLELKITNNALPKVAKTDPEAYKLFLEAKYAMYSTFSIEGDKKAEQLLKKSLAIDPNYAPAWEQLGWVYHFQADNGDIPKDEAYQLVKNAAYKAFEADSTRASINELLGTFALDYLKDKTKANEYAEKGLLLEPDNPYVLNIASQVALIKGDIEKAIVYNKKIAILDPLTEYSYYALGISYYFGRNYPEAEKAFKKGLELTPEAEITYMYLSCVYLKQGRLDDALVAAKKEKNEALREQSLALVYHSLGEKNKAQKALDKLLSEDEKDHSYLIASIYAHYNQKEKAFLWLEKAIKYDDFGLRDLNLDPLFEPISDDARWNLILKRLDLVTINL